MKAKPQLNGLSPAAADAGLLIRQAQAGDVRAFEELVAIYQDKIVTMSFYLTGNYADAQDLAQEVFVRAYTSIRNFRREANLGTWLHRITVNLWSNMQRGQKFTNLLSLDDPVQTGEGDFSRTVVYEDHEGDPAGALEGKELQKSVQQALRTLPAEYRTVLVLREIEAYSYEEIAKIAGCSLGTVKSRLNRARQALREEIRGREQETFAGR